jgi:hypothetical protein
VATVLDVQGLCVGKVIDVESNFVCGFAEALKKTPLEEPDRWIKFSKGRAP